MSASIYFTELKYLSVPLSISLLLYVVILKILWISKIKTVPWNFFKGYMIISLLSVAKFFWWRHFLLLDVYNLVRQEEKQQEINVQLTHYVDAATLQASKSSFCPSGKRQRPFYQHCNKHGHTLATCYQIHGFPNKILTNKGHRHPIPLILLANWPLNNTTIF